MGDTMVVSDTTARGLLMLSLRPRPMLIPTSYTVVLDTPDTMDLDMLDTMDWDTMVVSDTMARGLLMLRPIPTLSTGTRIRTETPRIRRSSRIRIRIPRRILLRQVDYIKIFQ